MSYKLCLVNFPSTKGALICTAFKRFYSEEMRVLKNVDTAYLKRGTGGRSSFNGNVVTIFGATGFMGKFVCNQLGKRGCQLIIPHRCDTGDPSLKHLRLAGDLGQVLFQPFNLKDPLSIRKAIKYSNVVINLIGRNFETSNFNFHQVHVKGAKEIAAACREYNVEKLIHFSALNVTENPEKFYLKNYQFLPSKLKGEDAVLEEFPAATIFRPAAVYGANDSFLWPLCAAGRLLGKSVPLYAKGEKTIRQPVFVSDVVQGIVAVINDYDCRGKIYQAVGPERFYLKDIAIFCSQILQRHFGDKRNDELIHNIKYDIMYPLKVLFFRNFVEMFFHMPCRNLAFEFIERESVTDEVCSTMPTLLDLGVPLSKFEDLVPSIIFDHFKCNPAMARTYKDFVPVESLSMKAVNEMA